MYTESVGGLLQLQCSLNLIQKITMGKVSFIKRKKKRKKVTFLENIESGNRSLKSKCVDSHV